MNRHEQVMYRTQLIIFTRGIALGRGVTAAFRLLFGGWRRWLWLLLAIAATVWGIEHVLRHIRYEPAKDWIYLHLALTKGPWTFDRVIAPVFVLWVIGWRLLKIRRRVVFMGFTETTKLAAGNAGGAAADTVSAASAVDSPASSLATLVVVQLAKMRDLYEDIEDERTGPVAGSSKPIDPTIHVDDIGEFLRSAVKADTKVSLGVLEIPIGSFVTFLAQLLRGPRIEGTVHRFADRVVITAHMDAGRLSHSWQVEEMLDARGAMTRAWKDLVEELTCRMFADLSLNGSVRWRATASFNRGLGTYRECLRTPAERRWKLRDAERCFVEAIADDERFDLAYYNLGVVYTEMGRIEAAAILFNKAIAHGRQRWQHYYALAANKYERQDPEGLEECVSLCQRCVELSTTSMMRAKSWDLMGFAHRRSGELLLRTGAANLNRSRESILRSCECHEKAFWFAFRAACVAPGQPIPGRAAGESYHLVATCLRNLGSDYATLALTWGPPAPSAPGAVQPGSAGEEKARVLVRRACAILAYARDLGPGDPNTRIELATAMSQSHELSHPDGPLAPEVRSEYEAALRIDASRADAWALLAMLHERHGDRSAAERAWKHFRLGAPMARKVDLEGAAREARKRGLIDGADTVERVAGLLNQIASVEKRERNEFAALEQRLPLRTRDQWERGQACIILMRLALIWEDDCKAVWYAKWAIDMLADYPEEIERHGLQAEVMRHKGDARAALRLAAASIFRSPLSAPIRRTMGNIQYFSLEDHVGAGRSWDDALLWEPGAVANHLNLGVLNDRKGSISLNREAARDLLGKAAHHFTRALEAIELYESGQSGRITEIHMLLGRVFRKIGRYDEALAHFAMAGRRAPGTAAFLSGQVYYCVGRFAECNDELKKSIKLARRSRALSGESAWEPEGNLGITPRDVMVEALTMLAWVAAEHDGNYCWVKRQLRDARRLVRTARHRAQCDAAEGWVRFKLLGNAAGAAALIGASVGVVRDERQWDARQYLRLGLVYERRGRACKDPVLANLCLDAAVAYCRRAANMSLAGDLDAAIIELQGRLGNMPEAPSPAPNVLLQGAATPLRLTAGGQK